MNPDLPDEMLNVRVVLKACGGHQAIARTLIQRFLAILPDEWTALEQAYRQNDREVLRQRAHRLRSGGLYVGAGRIAVAAERLEETVLTGASQETLTRAWENLHRECQALLAQPQERWFAAL